MDRWNSGRHEAQRESGILGQIAVELAADTADLNENLRYNAAAQVARDSVLAWLDGDRPFDSATANVFATGMIFTNFVANAAAYENLKSVGVDLVSEDRLRLEITRYYESRYTFVENTEEVLLNPHWTGDLVPRMMEHFDVVFWTEASWPRDVAALRADRGLRSSIATFGTMVEFADGASRQALEQAESLLDLVTDHVDDD